MYNSFSPAGWPQLVVSVFGQDFFGRDVLAGTGSIHVPIGPGTYERIIPLFKPKSSSFLQKAAAFFGGSYPEFIDKNFPAQAIPRHGLLFSRTYHLVLCTFFLTF